MHKCGHCDCAYKGLKYLINHIQAKHPKVDTSDMTDQYMRQAYKNRQAVVKASKPIKHNADGMTYKEFMKVKSAELKETMPELTKQSDRMKVIGQLWKASKESNPSQEPIQEPIQEPVATVEPIISPEPQTIPIPINLIKRIQTAKVVDDTIDELITDTDYYIKAVTEMQDEKPTETIAELIDTTDDKADDNAIEDCIDEMMDYVAEDAFYDDKVDIDIDEELIECCATIHRGGFVRAYRILLDREEIEPLDKDKINEDDELPYGDLEDVYNAMCDAWCDYRRTVDYTKERHVFNDEACWRAVRSMYVNRDTIHDFF